MVKLIVNRVPNQSWHRRMNRVIVCDSELFFDVSVLTAYSKPLFSDISLQHSRLCIWLWHLALASDFLWRLTLASGSGI
jgi:hypothetical protein